MGRLEELKEAWESDRADLILYTERITNGFHNNALGLEATAIYLGCNPIELIGMLHLAGMEDECLKLLSSRLPHVSTWMLISYVDDVTVLEETLDKLDKRKKGDSSFRVAREALNSYLDLSPLDRIASLSGKTLLHMHKKSVNYDLLWKKARDDLDDIARKKKRGVLLSGPQLGYIQSLLMQLYEGNAISRESPDNDKKECDEVLDALGV